jgi:predicted AlkP superfamily pyrophosphatase or phosphodiesterase
MIRRSLIAAFALLSTTASFAKHHEEAPAPVAATTPAAPKLVIAISVDQFSSDLFDEYRPSFTGGLKRLASQGIAFSNGYQSHAATETCPGHSTILTGDHPTRTGVIANNWVDLDAKRDDKSIYCSEDENVKGSDSKNYTVSALHLKVPTLGERLKMANPATRVVSVAGKDRAVIMMGGHMIDEAWWWTSRNNLYQFTSFDGKTAPAAVAAANAKLAAMTKSGYSYPLPEVCKARIAPIQFGDRTIGIARPDIKAGDATAGAGLYTHPALDAATLDAALGLITDMKLGQGPATDVLDIGLSVTDPVGHAFGTEGPEMCGQLDGLDTALGAFLDKLDATGVNYVIALTADHGGSDIPERKDAPKGSVRLDDSIRPVRLDIAVGNALGIQTKAVYGDNSDGAGNIYIAHDLAPDVRAKVAAVIKKEAMSSPFVYAVYSRDEILAAPKPSGPLSDWTVLQRIAASYDPVRSGDLYIVPKERVMPLSDTSGSVMAHGSVWNYDRRVPILFYAKGMTPANKPDQIETVDIMPTFASMVGLKLADGEVDGKCLSAVTACVK